jgi:hypothetical protein
MKRRPHDIVEVSWIDSSSSHAEVWGTVKDFLANKTSTLECRTVGYLLFETKDRIGIAASLSLQDETEHNGISEVSGTITIPKVSIVDQRVLSKGQQ